MSKTQRQDPEPKPRPRRQEKRLQQHLLRPQRRPPMYPEPEAPMWKPLG